MFDVVDDNPLPKMGRACQPDPLHISCRGYEHIYILTANFGRLDYHFCHGERTLGRSLKICRSWRSMFIVMSL